MTRRTPTKLSLVLINYNGYKWLDKCLRSITNQSYKNYEIIFVDNNSSDGNYALLRKNHPDVKFYSIPNKGYGIACNYGAAQASGDYLMFLNVDLYIEDKNFLSRFIDFAATLNNKASLGTIGCRIDNYDKSRDINFDHYGYRVDFLGVPTIRSNREQIFYNPGCVLFISKQTFTKVGGFCPNIFLYSEDIDLCWRLSLMGYKHYYLSDVSVYHEGGGITGELSANKISFYIQGELNTLLNNYGNLLLLIILPVYFIYYCALIIYYLFSLKFSYIRSILSTFVLVFTQKMPQIKKFRRFVQKNRTVTDMYILRKMSLIPSRLRNCFIK